jgi:hypothetical protein
MELKTLEEVQAAIQDTRKQVGDLLQLERDLRELEKMMTPQATKEEIDAKTVILETTVSEKLPVKNLIVEEPIIEEPIV